MIPNFFSEYRILNEGTEIPPLFTAWCSVSAVASVLGRKVWLDMGPFTVYPNMFVILVAGSGKERKSTAINVTGKMLKSLVPAPTLISKKVTVAGLVEELKVNIVGSAYVGSSQGTLITDELINFLNPGSLKEGLGDLLIDLYDCSADFDYGTRSQGKEKLRDLQLNLLAGTTPESLAKAIPEDSIGSGLASRMLFVFENTPMKPVALPIYTPRQNQAKEFCLKALERIRNLKGSVSLSKECREWFTHCYNTRCWNSPFYHHHLLSGYASRRSIHLIKLAIALTAGISETLDLKVELFEQAEALLSKNEERLEDVIRLMTMTDQGRVAEMVLSIITKARKIDRERLLHQVSHKINSRELTDVLETLIRSKRILVHNDELRIYYLSAN